MPETQSPVLRREERALLSLRALYEQYGYAPFKMSKFEEYDFYAENRSFLRGESILTFSDLSGRLMALKPDVTLSIVKNARGGDSNTEKVYYNENVYRAPRGERAFREIMQTGLECIGAVSLYEISEVVYLAAESLSRLGEGCILDLSHMGLGAGLLEAANLPPHASATILSALRRKNAAEILGCCAEFSADAEISKKLASLCEIYGPFPETLQRAKALIVNEATDAALRELEAVYQLVSLLGAKAQINLDFSIDSDLRYYGGVIFQGFAPGIPGAVLSGGRYDNLLSRFGKSGGAIGFAVYLGMLSGKDADENPFDADVCLQYDDETDLSALARAVKMLTERGQSVKVQKGEGGRVRCRQKLKMADRGLEILE